MGIIKTERADFDRVRKEVFDQHGKFIDYEVGEEMQLVVKENNKQPGKPIFVLENGKCGFSTVNSIPSEIGDTVRGKMKLNLDTVFFVEVNEIIQKAPAGDETDTTTSVTKEVK